MSAPSSKQASAPVTIRLTRLAHGQDLALPAYQSADAAGFDLLAAVPADTPLLLRPGERVLVPTGLALEIPRGFEGQVRPRSGLAHKHGITVLNAPGTIDADYRGELKVLLINHGSDAHEIRRGDRIAQLVIAAVAQALLVEADALTESPRGAGGFGSTGTR